MKKFTICFLLLLLPLYLLTFYYHFFIEPNVGHELGGVAQVPFGHEYTKMLENNYLSKLNVDQFYIKDSNKTYEVASIGDSFSQQGVYGYQNYLATSRGDRILNFSANNIMTPSVQMALNLLNEGYFNKLKIKVVIVESVERYFISRLRDLDFQSKVSVDSLLLSYRKEVNKMPIPLFEKTCAWIRLSFGYHNIIKHATLNDKYFNHPKFGNKLYFIDEDLTFQSITSSDIYRAKKNLKHLHNLFESHGIKFIYLVAADKYDIYQPFILNNLYPRNPLLDYFDSIPYVLNSKKILFPLIKNGVKDIYMVNDSHWSYKASKVIANELKRRINSN